MSKIFKFFLICNFIFFSFSISLNAEVSQEIIQETKTETSLFPIIYVAQLNPKVGDLEGNTNKIIESIKKAKEKNAKIVIFPEAIISGYPPKDFLLKHDYIEKIDEQLQRIIKETKDIFVVLGSIRKNTHKNEKELINCAVIISDGKLVGYKNKTLLPTYDVFDERRYFEPGLTQNVFEFQGKKIGILVCEDGWAHDNFEDSIYDIDPVRDLEKLKPDLVIDIAASIYHLQKREARINIFTKVAQTLKVPVILCNQIGTNDQLIFDGSSFCLNEKGELIYLLKSFEEDEKIIDLNKKNDVFTYENNLMQELHNALVFGIRDSFKKQNFKKALVCLNGDLNSSLVLCLANEALGNNEILAISMPSSASNKTTEDIIKLVQNLNVKFLNIPIDSIYNNYSNFLSPILTDKSIKESEENLQARIRGMILMDISNGLGNTVLVSACRSDLAIGNIALYGDKFCGLGVLNDVSKTLIYSLTNWINRDKEIVPKSIIEKETLINFGLNQSNSRILPSYEILDKILEAYIEENLTKEEIIKKYGFKEEIVKNVISQIHQAEYKRYQCPPGIRISRKSLLEGNYFPIVQGWIN